MKILITGGTTFVSRYAAEYFVSAGHDLTVLNRGNRQQVRGVQVVHGSSRQRILPQAVYGVYRQQADMTTSLKAPFTYTRGDFCFAQQTGVPKFSYLFCGIF